MTQVRSSIVIERDETIQISPKSNAYRPAGGCLELFYCQNEEILLEGPANTGKTRGAIEKSYFCATKYPGIRILWLRKTRESLTETVLVTFEEKVLPTESYLKEGPDRARRQRYSLKNGSDIVLGGLDKVSRIMSSEYDIIVLFEATETSENDLEMLTTRLRNGRMPYQQLIAECNPGAPRHYLNQRALSGRMTRILSRHKDNPSVTEKYLQVLSRLTGARKARLLGGQWTAQEGLVYSEYDPDIHVLSDVQLKQFGFWFERNTGIPHGFKSTFCTVDWGFTNPGVIGVWALDSDGRMYLIRELYQTQQTNEWWQKQAVIIQKYFQPVFWACDPSEPAWIKALKSALRDADHQVHDVRSAINEIRPGIDLVQERLKVAKDGRPKLYIRFNSLQRKDEARVEAKEPVSTREEFDSYAWPPGQDGKDAKEVPVGEDDHGMDMMRYAVAEQDMPRSSRRLRTF